MLSRNVSLFCALVAFVSCQRLSPIIKTKSGLVQGTRENTPLGHELFKFLGIPYATPPLGVLRFTPPLKVQPWQGLFKATEISFSCFQKSIPFIKETDYKYYFPSNKFSEDCLKLNIWVPKDKPDKTSVMVFIHGGGHANGGISSPMFDGSILATEEKVIVVTFNYRLASLGFLFLDHPDIPGNAGLYDQSLALKWIKKNIASFGGNPGSITLFGHISGAASIGHHMISQNNRGLFDRAILMSSSTSAEWAVDNKQDALKKSSILLENLGCPYNSSNISATVHCLQIAPAKDLIDNEMQIGYSYFVTHVPVIDGTFISEYPTISLRNGHFANVSIMTGSVKNESTVYLGLVDPIRYSMLSDNPPISIHDFENFFDIFDLNEQTLKMSLYLYLEDLYPTTEPHPKYLEAIAQLVSDYVFICPLVEWDIAYTKAGNDVFKYYFTHHTSTWKTRKWVGTAHGEELQYVFGDPFRGTVHYSPDEERLSRRMMRYWANFARTGNPNNGSDSEDELIFWPRHTFKEKEYLILAPNSSSVGNAFRGKHCLFWQQLRPELNNLCK